MLPQKCFRISGQLFDVTDAQHFSTGIATLSIFIDLTAFSTSFCWYFLRSLPADVPYLNAYRIRFFLLQLSPRCSCRIIAYSVEPLIQPRSIAMIVALTRAVNGREIESQTANPPSWSSSPYHPSSPRQPPNSISSAREKLSYNPL